VKLLQQIHGVAEDEVAVYFPHFKALRANKREPEAHEYLQKAYEALMRQAEAIKDKRSRQSFLRKMKTHQEIIQAWEEKSKREGPTATR